MKPKFNLGCDRHILDIGHRTYFQKRALAPSYYVKTKLDLVYFGFQQPTRNSIKHTRYISRERMACDLAPNCNFLFSYFSGTLLKDMIDIDITMHMLKGIHTFRKYQTMQVSKCSPWGMGDKLFPSLRRR